MRGPHHDGALPDARARWIADVRQEAESRAFRWSFWCIGGPADQGMTIRSLADPQRIDAATAIALGKSAD